MLRTRKRKGENIGKGRKDTGETGEEGEADSGAAHGCGWDAHGWQRNSGVATGRPRPRSQDLRRPRRAGTHACRHGGATPRRPPPERAPGAPPPGVKTCPPGWLSKKGSLKL